jgi:ribosome-binding protein aMBF1 (putative translation factor)
MGKAIVSACSRCTEKMNLGPKETAPGLARAQVMNARPAHQTGYAARGKKGKDIMLKAEKELVDDFAKRITNARKAKGWNQPTLGKRMAETVNIIKSTESGKRPTDSVLKKFERVLSITLFETSSAQATQRVDNSSSRGMTLGDYLDDIR